jgi:hypothetical protein
MEMAGRGRSSEALGKSNWHLLGTLQLKLEILLLSLLDIYNRLEDAGCRSCEADDGEVLGQEKLGETGTGTMNRESRIKNWRKEHLDIQPSLFLDTILYDEYGAAK